jgi:kinesin family protein 18/19
MGLIGKAEPEQKYLESKLSFIDLAGSERVSLAQNMGLRITEGSNINKSLLALGKVINKLSEKRNGVYIPYRDSKLTRLLKDSLGGNTRTVLITCITPNRGQKDETIHSLNYAFRAKKIKTDLKRNNFRKINNDMTSSRVGFNKNTSLTAQEHQKYV